MNKGRLVLLALAVAVVTVFSLVVRAVGDAAPAGQSSSVALPDSSTAGSSPTNAPSSAAPTTSEGPKVAGANFEMKKLAPGEKPPQFVLFSFDGAGSHEKWQTFLATAKQVNAQFTGFLTGIYLIDNDHRTAYTGPGHSPGKASVSFGGTKQDIYNLVGDLNAAKAAGMEIGTHFNGHFCAGSEPSGKDWSTDQWNNELDQFFGFLANWPTINGYTDAPKLAVTAADIRGERTPCLEGSPDILFPALQAHGMQYDTSQNRGGTGWPQVVNGVWEFYMPYVTVPATGKGQIAMDYNFWYQFNGGANEPGRAQQFSSWVLGTYEAMYNASFNGSRGPLVIGNHFNDWSGNAFNPAVQSFMQEVCTKPETVCTTYQNVLKWMSIQDPAVLAALLALPRDQV